MLTIIEILAKVGLWFLDRFNASEKRKEQYIKFIESMEPHHKSSMRLRDSYMSQRKANNAKIKEKIKSIEP